MQINISETMRQTLEKCVRFAINKNAWISSIDVQADYEVTMQEALEFLQELKD